MMQMRAYSLTLIVFTVLNLGALSLQAKTEHLECVAEQTDPVFVLNRFADGKAQLSTMLNPASPALPIFHGRVYDTYLEDLAKRAELYRKIGRALNLTLDQCTVEYDGDYIHCYNSRPHMIGDVEVDRFSFYYIKRTVKSMGEEYPEYTVGIEFIHQNYRFDLPIDYSGDDCKSTVIN